MEKTRVDLFYKLTYYVSFWIKIWKMVNCLFILNIEKGGDC